MVKPRLYDKENPTRKYAQYTLNLVLCTALKLLHPFMPFITEKIYLNLFNEDKTIMLAEWPKYDKTFDFTKEEKCIEQIKKIIIEIRNIRTNMNVHPSKKAKMIFVTTDYKDIVEKSQLFIKKLGFGEEVEVQVNKASIPENAISIVQDGVELYMPFEELVDMEAERKRLEEEKIKVQSEIQRAQKMLSNQGFISKAPQAKIDEEKEKLAKYEEMLKGIEERLK